MRKRIALIMVTVSVLLMAGCGASNSAEDPAGADSQMAENIGQTDTEENIDDAASSSETQKPAKEEDWEDKALLDEYAAYGIEKDGDFYYYQGELVYLIKNQYPDSSVYSLNTDSTGTISIKVTRNAKGEITSVSYLTEEEVAKALPRILGGMGEERDKNTDVLSPLDRVTMEVTEYSDTSVTVRITNNTDRDIECGSDFCLEMQDEETGEWREVDTVIDDAAFDAIAYMIQKDSPYEEVIDFEWLYGKLEPGRYHIVKTIADFRGTGDYTDYKYMAEFSIEEDSDIVNAEELADTFGILISLPENTTWIADGEYYLIDENNLRISYHDSVADADCTLLVSKNNNLNLPQAEYDETLNESWEGYTIGRQHIVVKVQHENNDEKMVLATWEYNEYQFAIIGENVNDSTPIPKVALYIIGKLD